MKKPCIFEFLDAVHFLNACLQYRKSENSKYSISAWCQEMNFSSKITLRFILRRQRSITPAAAEKFKKNLDLVADESRYFDLLVSYSQSRSEIQKQAFGQQLLKIQRAQFQQISLPQEVAARHEMTPVLLTLLTFEDIDKDASTLANILGENDECIAEVLNDMVADGLIERDSHGHFHFSKSSFKIPSSPNLKKFYKYWLEKAIEAMALPQEVRKYRSLKFALSEEEFSEVLEKINDYSMALLSSYQSSSLNGKSLYMLASALFPISKKVLELDNSKKCDAELV